MWSRTYHGAPDGAGATRAAVGVDLGATLAKLAMRTDDGRLVLGLVGTGSLDEVGAQIERMTPGAIGVTGGGASRLAERLARPVVRVDEFSAWGHGVAELLERTGESAPRRHLLVSLGTGTSVMRVDHAADPRVERVGGTALGGGTIMGLGAALLDTHDFDQIVELAARGRRERVDLLVRDIYPPGEFSLSGGLTAASFGRLAHGDAQGARREDLAAAIVGLVAENVGLIAGGLAALTRIDEIVYAGGTLRSNPSAQELLRGLGAAFDRRVRIPSDGEFSGALGALLVAVDGSAPS